MSFNAPSLSLLLLALCIFSSPIGKVQSAATTTTGITVWPEPRILKWPSPQQATLLSPSFTITTNAAHHIHLSAAISRYLRLILTEHHRPLVLSSTVNFSTDTPPLQSLTITVTEPASPLHHGVDESYSLTIPTTGPANLTAATPWGAIRGLETFSQLVWGDPTRVAVGVYVWDAPIFGHRGVMLDTSRNYFPVEDILRMISAMSMNKMNVFHWHITDSHSFPLVVPSEPELADKGSYGSDMLYSPADVARIVRFGLDHGVRVLPEIDSPGGTGSWALAYPETVTCANMFWMPPGGNPLAAGPGTGHLNPLNPKTYTVLKNVIKDVTSLFPEPFYHGGGDEVIPACWKTDPTIQTFLANNGTLNHLLEIFINSTLPYIISLNRTVVYWEDVFLSDRVHVPSTILPKENVILQTWSIGHNSTKRLVSSGYRTIVSSADFYYLDCVHGDFVGKDSKYDIHSGDQGDGCSWCGPIKTWQLIYSYDITYGLSEDEAKLVLGGEVALWTEQADQTVLDSRLWPRTSAMAESLWSGNTDEKGVKRYAEATVRLAEWRNRMVRRGIGAEPIQPLWCARNPGMCNYV